MVAGMAPSQRLFTDEQERQLAVSYNDGLSHRELAERFGGTPATIRNALRRQGVPARRRGNAYREWTAAEVTDIAERWKNGESQTAIARAHGTSQVSVSRLLAKNGIRVGNRLARGERHGMWRGGRHVAPSGYVFVRVSSDDPIARAMFNSTGYVAEHRLVMARLLGRPLRRTESVHHVNGDKQDNRPENLQLRHGVHGKGVAARCACCGSRDIAFDEID